MNMLKEMLPEPMIKALGWTLVHSLWQGVVAALILALLMLLLHRSSSTIRYFVALATLLTTFCTAVATFLVIYRDTPAQVSWVPAGVVTPINAVALTNGLPDTLSSTSLLDSFSHYFDQHLPLIVTVWLLGITLLALRLLSGLAYVQRLRHYQVQPLSLVWQQRLRSLGTQMQLRQSIRIAESSLAKVPMVVGYMKPLILLPLGTVAGIPSDQVEAILAHELAHIRRKDYLINLFQSAIEIVFFFHPAVWWISGCVREEREHCCDDIAITHCGDSLLYAKALANLEMLHLQPAPQLAMALTGKSGSLLNRIERFLKQPRRNPDFSEGIVAALVLVAGILAVSASATAGFVPDKKVFQTTPQTPANTQIKPQSNISTTPVMMLEDSSRRRNEMTIVKNKKGKVIELYIDGQKIPKDQIENYRDMIEGRTQHMPVPPVPVAVVAPPAPLTRTPLSPAAPIPAPGVRSPRPVRAPLPPRPDRYSSSDEEVELDELDEELERVTSRLDNLANEMEALDEEINEQPEKEPARLREAMRKLEAAREEQERKMERIHRLHEDLSKRHEQRMQIDARHHDEEMRKHERSMRENEARMRQHEAEARKHEAIARKQEKAWQTITKSLKADKLIKDENSVEFKISRNRLYVNGEKQSDALYEKYRKMIEAETGKPFKDTDTLHYSHNKQ
jgi:bla regulator protein blaR1